MSEPYEFIPRAERKRRAESHLNEIDSCMDILSLLIDLLAFLRKDGNASVVWGMEEVMNMVYSRLSETLDEMREETDHA